MATKAHTEPKLVTLAGWYIDEQGRRRFVGYMQVPEHVLAQYLESDGMFRWEVAK